MASTIKFSDLEFLPADQLSLASIAPVVQGGKNYRIALSSINQYDYDHCDDIVQLRNVTSCPGTSAISISADLDLNDHSIINIAANSLKFTNGSKISTTPDGGIEIIPFDGDSLICGGSSGVPLPFVSGGPLSAATNNIDLWNATAEIISNQSDCWQDACNFVSTNASSLSVLAEQSEIIYELALILAGGGFNSGLSANESFNVEVSGMPDITFVDIADVGNDSDENGYGAVDEEYKISKYGITFAQLTAYNAGNGPQMQIDLPNNGAWDSIPYINLKESAHFINWLNTSQGYDPAYKFEPTSTEPSINDNLRTWTEEEDKCGIGGFVQTGARYTLPTEDQWVKAAYYDANGQVGYSDYANGSDDFDGIGYSGSLYAGETESYDKNNTDSQYNVYGMDGGKHEFVLSDTTEGSPIVQRGGDYQTLPGSGGRKYRRSLGEFSEYEYDPDYESATGEVGDGGSVDIASTNQWGSDQNGTGTARVVDKGIDPKRYGTCQTEAIGKLSEKFKEVLEDSRRRKEELEALEESLKALQEELGPYNTLNARLTSLEACCETTTSAVSALSAGNEFMQVPFTSNIKIIDAINQQQFDAKQLEGGCDDGTMYVIN